MQQILSPSDRPLEANAESESEPEPEPELEPRLEFLTLTKLRFRFVQTHPASLQKEVSYPLPRRLEGQSEHHRHLPRR